ncbi:MAG: trimethylamine methyltransferase family protein [Pseudomonadota bacterium]|nr:trimethylamine methyltransferase family protein [Pseudomonadota bacterium]
MRRDKAGAAIAQMPWRNVRNPYPPMEMPSPDQMQDLHDISIRILNKLGIKVLRANVRALFARAGAKIDEEGIVRIDEGLVSEALKTVPQRFCLTPRNPATTVTLGDDHLVFGLVAGPPNVHDPINVRRSGNLTDYQNSSASRAISTPST